MTTHVYIFNPQNDLALATGSINYVAPPFAVRMAADLAVLPAFIAEPGSLLITDSDLDAEWLEQLNSTFGFDVHAVKTRELRRLSNYRIIPWGWCLDMRRRLLKWGASQDSVPTKDEIYHLRGLSHRRVTTLIHMRLLELLGQELCPMPVELATSEEVMDYVKEHGDCYIKTPWSSSGRGIYHTTGGITPEFEQWCRGALKRQGSVMCEQALDKVMDLAVEFNCCEGKAQVRGYSVFETDSHSQYSHGEVATGEALKGLITERYRCLDRVVDALTQVLDEMVSAHYNGWLGVDMLLYNAQCTMHNAQSFGDAQCVMYNAQSFGNAQCTMHNAQSFGDAQCTMHNAQSFGDAQCTMHNAQSSGVIGINPCVEINLRPTMGAVTSVLGERVLAKGATGTFAIEQRASTSEPWRPLPAAVLKDCRLASGALCLTTSSPSAMYRAVLEVNP